MARPVFALLTIAALCSAPVLRPAAAQSQPVFTNKPDLGPKLNLTLPPRTPLPPESIQKIKASIAGLADIADPDFGFSSTLSGEAFAALPGQSHADMMLMTDHHLKASADFKALVQSGPDAIPYLLAALDDKTPSKLVMTHESGFGAMWFSNEASWNSWNPPEKEAFADYKRADEDLANKTLQTYTVRVGDICFVALGQIVGRDFNAVRYQPTACIVINSPVENADLCSRIRKAWTSDDPRQTLLNALLTDYAMQRHPDAGTAFQAPAAMRLLYYFPAQSAGPIAERLNSLAVKNCPNLDDWQRQRFANGLDADKFVSAVAASGEPKIREALRGILARTDDYEIAIAAMPAVSDKPFLKERITALLALAPAEEKGAYGGGYQLLGAAYGYLGDDAAPLFEMFLKQDTAQHAYSVATLLQSIPTAWSDAILARLLNDKRPMTAYGHGITSPNDDKRLDIRVCDQAARALSAHHAELKFQMLGTAEQLDAQIKAIQSQLAK